MARRPKSVRSEGFWITAILIGYTIILLIFIIITLTTIIQRIKTNEPVSRKAIDLAYRNLSLSQQVLQNTPESKVTTSYMALILGLHIEAPERKEILWEDNKKVAILREICAGDSLSGGQMEKEMISCGETE